MPTISDDRFESLRGQGFTGATSDMLLQWLQDNGATANAVPDAWKEFLLLVTGLPEENYHRNDYWYQYLDLVAPPEIGRQLNDLEAWFWDPTGGGGVPGGNYVNAGGPYSGDRLTAIQLNGTARFEDDPNPTYFWEIISGGTGTFTPGGATSTAEDPTFTPDDSGPYVLQLTGTGVPAGPLSDTADLNSIGIAPQVDAGPDNAGPVGTQIALDGTIIPGDDPNPDHIWEYVSGVTGTIVAPQLVDTAFVPSAVGNTTLRLTATPNDGPPVSDTMQTTATVAPDVGPPLNFTATATVSAVLLTWNDNDANTNPAIHYTISRLGQADVQIDAPQRSYVDSRGGDDAVPGSVVTWYITLTNVDGTSQSVSVFYLIPEPLTIFNAPLQTSLLPLRAIGAYEPTFSRNSVGTFVDFEGIVRTTGSDEPRFQGSRKVYNLFFDYSPAGTAVMDITGNGSDAVAVCSVLGAGSASSARCRSTGGLLMDGRTFQSSIFIKATSGADIGKTVRVQFSRGAGGSNNPVVIEHTLTADYLRVSAGLIVGVEDNTRPIIYIFQGATGTPSTTCTITKGQIEDISGQANQFPAEYIAAKTGPLLTDYIINGDFDTDTDWIKEQGWTISAGVATCSFGGNETAIIQGPFVGVLDLTKPYRVSLEIIDVVTLGSLRVFLTASGTDRLVESIVQADIPGETLYFDLNLANETWEAGDEDNLVLWIQAKYGWQGSIDNVKMFEYSESAVNLPYKQFQTVNANTVANGIVNELNPGAPFSQNPSLYFFNDDQGPWGYISEDASTNLCLHNRNFTNGVWAATNITPAQDALGMDGVAGEASTLTADANNGTILQTVTSASAQRTISCEIKRKTGTGTVEITVDGGATWVDVTGDINGSTYSRVQYTQAAVANPQIGFRLGASGDAIEVDYFQLENLPFSTTHIATTTLPVNRAADLLTYLSAGNIEDAEGSAYCQASTQWKTAEATSHAVGYSSSGTGIYVLASDGDQQIRVGDGTNESQSPAGGALMSIAPQAVTQTWNTVGTEMIAYYNGTPDASPASYDGAMAGINISPGGRGDVTTSNWGGTVRKLQIYDVTLTPDQVADLPELGS